MSKTTAEERGAKQEAAWVEYMTEHGWLTMPVSAQAGADFAAGWNAHDAEVEALERLIAYAIWLAKTFALTDPLCSRAMIAALTPGAAVGGESND